MKKLGFMMSLMLGLFVSVCALTACSSDDDGDGNASLYGTWCYDYKNGDNETVHVEITLNKDFTCKLRRYCDHAEHNYDVTITGTYEIDGNKLSILWDGSSIPEVSTFEIKGNKAYIDGGSVVATKK